MKLHKVVNRVYRGTTYYRWVVSIPPRKVRDLGWVNGQELEVVVQGTSLWVRPSIRLRTPKRDRSAERVAGEAEIRAFGGRRA